MTDLYRLVYTSKNLLQGSKEEIGEAVEGILATSQRNNTRVGVTGALMFNDGAFAQVLEGPQRAVEATFERIQRDPRHGDVTVLQAAVIDAPSFPNWSMAFVGQSSAGQAFWHDMAAASGFDLSRLQGDDVFSMLHGLVLEEEGVSASVVGTLSRQPDAAAAAGSFDDSRVQAELPRPGQALTAKRNPVRPVAPTQSSETLPRQIVQTAPVPADTEKSAIALAIFRAALADERRCTTELRNELDEARVLLAQTEARIAAVSSERDLWAGRARLLATAMCAEAPAAWSDRTDGSGVVAIAPTATPSTIRNVA